MLDPYKFTSQTLAGKIIRLPLKLIPSGLDVPIRQGPNKGLLWRTGSSVHGCWLGTYEREKVELLSRYVKPGTVAYDIGANAGYYTLLLSRLVGPSGRVIAFEPLPENLVNLTHHVLVNRLSNCEVVAAAVSERTGLAGFRMAASNSMGSIARTQADFRVATISLDDGVGVIGLPPPDFVKMDVEGAEGLVLAGANELLRGHPAVWFAALHGAEPARSVLAVFRTNGYRVQTLAGVEVEASGIDTLDEVFAMKE